MTETPALVLYDAMCLAIAEAYKVDEAKQIRDKAIAIAAYARQISNHDAEDRCSKIRLRAERRAAQLYDQATKAEGAREPGTHRGTTRSVDGTASKTLRDHGISKQQMSNWRKLAAIPESEFEVEVTRQHMPTVASVLLATGMTEPEEVTLITELEGVTPVTDEALWLWGRLCDFESDGLLQKDPQQVLKTMTAEMLEDTLELAPLVSAWISRISGDKH